MKLTMRNPRVKKPVSTLAQRLRAVRGGRTPGTSDQELPTELKTRSQQSCLGLKMSDEAAQAIATQLRVLAAENGITVETRIDRPSVQEGVPF